MPVACLSGIGNVAEQHAPAVSSNEVDKRLSEIMKGHSQPVRSVSASRPAGSLRGWRERCRLPQGAEAMLDQGLV